MGLIGSRKPINRIFKEVKKMFICDECEKKHKIRVFSVVIEGKEHKLRADYYGVCKYCSEVKRDMFYIETTTERINRKRREYKEEMKSNGRNKDTT